MCDDFNHEKLLTQDDKDYRDYLGVGLAHREPPPKKFKPRDQDDDEEYQDEEPKSKDVFDTPESQDTRELEIEEPRNGSPDPQSKDVFESEGDESMVVDSQSSSSEEPVPQKSKRVRQPSEVSEEYDESYMSDMEIALTPGQKKWRGDERRSERKEEKIQDEGAESADNTMVHQEMETSGEFRTPIQKSISSASSSNEGYLTAADASTEMPPLENEVFKTPVGNRRVPLSDSTPPMLEFEGSTKKSSGEKLLNIEISKSAEKKNLETPGKKAPLELLERTPRGIKTPESTVKKEKEEPKSPAPTTSSATSDASTPNRMRGMRRHLESLLTTFHEGQLVFHPHLEEEKGRQNHIVYVDIPGVERTEPIEYGKILDQNWRSKNLSGEEIRSYKPCRLLMENFLKGYQDGGCMTFIGLLNDLYRDEEKYPALQRWMAYESTRLGSIAAVNEQFANIVRLALRAEHILPERIYLLRDTIRSATLSQEQCAALLSRIFFKKSGFLQIFARETPLALEKCKFIFTYFDKVCREMPDGNITFRLVVRGMNMEAIAACTDYDFDVRLSNTFTIEETALCTQVDFANKYLGGGVLSEGMVQEEIRFMMCPEMMVGMWLAAPMEHNQAISIVGAQVYSSYTGYARNTLWQPLQEKHAATNCLQWRDKFRRLRWECIAIDAVHFTGYDARQIFRNQLSVFYLNREIRKAYAGFSAQNGFKGVPIWSGWWGCGAFNGNKPLKFIIQMIAAKMANRPLRICVFGDTTNLERCRTFMEIISKKRITVGELYGMVCSLQSAIPMHPPEDYVFRKIRELIADRPVYSDATSETPIKLN